MRVLVFMLLGLLSAAPSFAQATVSTGPVTTGDSLEWVSIDPAVLPVYAQTLVWRVRVDAAVGGPFVLTGGTCQGSFPTMACRVRLTQELVNALNVQGNHSLVLRVFDPASGLESPDSDPFVLKAAPPAPSKPANFRITRP